MNHKRILSLVVLLNLLFVCSGIAQIMYPPVRNISPNEWSGHSQVFSAVQDDRGVMYFVSPTSNTAILEYDGSNWTMIYTKKESIPTSLERDSLGRVYVGGVSEFGYLAANDVGKMEFVSLSELLPTDAQEFGPIWNIEVCNEGVFFQTNNQVYKYSADTITILTPPNRFHVAASVNGKFYATDGNEGLMVYENDSLVHVPDGDYYPKNNVTFRDMVSNGDDGEMLVVTERAGLILWDSKAEVDAHKQWDIPAQKLIIGSKPMGLIRLRDGGIAVYTKLRGLIVLNEDGSLRYHLNENSGLQNEQIWCAYEDDHHNIWMTLQIGISVVPSKAPLTYLGKTVGWDKEVMDVAWFNGKMFVAGSDGVQMMNDYPADSLINPNYIPEFRKSENILVGTVVQLEVINDNLWMAGSGLYKYDGETVEKIGSFNFNSVVYSEKAPEVIFTGGQGELGARALRFEEGEWKSFRDTVADIYSLFTLVEWETDDEAIELWGGTVDKKLIRYRFWTDSLTRPEITAFDSASGLPDKEINVFTVDGEAVFGCTLGLFRFNRETGRFEKDDRFALPKTGTSFETQNDIFRLAQDSEGNLWIRGNERFWYGEVGASGIEWTYKDLVSIEQGSAKAVVWDDKKGIWFGSNEGLAHFDPTVERKLDIPFNAIIRNVSLTDNDSLLFAGTFYDVRGYASTVQEDRLKHVIPFEDNAISFQYAACFYEFSDLLEYKHKLIGFDDDWSAWDRGQEKEYTNLPEGKYTFNVVARNIFGLESNVASYEFTILPPWYRTIWAYLGYAIFGILLMYVVVKLNSRRLQAANLRLQLLIDEKTAEVRDQKDEIEAQRDDIAKKNKSLTDSIKYAKSLQDAILPASELIAKSFETHMVFFRPRDIVSGDFYWFHDQGDIAFFAAVDCTGHGVPGALVSMTGSNLLQNIIVERDLHTPGEILHELNIGVKAVFKRDGSLASANDGMDLALVAVHKESKMIRFAGAHNSMVIIRDGEILETKGDRTPIGGRTKPDYEFKTHEIQGQEGDMVYMYSDGYPDQFGGPENRKFMSSRFKKMLAEIYTLPPKEQIERLELNLDIWQGERSRIDDILVVGFKL